jgi:hypothetical protein
MPEEGGLQIDGSLPDAVEGAGGAALEQLWE